MAYHGIENGTVDLLKLCDAYRRRPHVLTADAVRELAVETSIFTSVTANRKSAAIRTSLTNIAQSARRLGCYDVILPIDAQSPLASVVQTQIAQIGGSVRFKLQDAAYGDDLKDLGPVKIKSVFNNAARGCASFTPEFLARPENQLSPAP